VSRVNGNTTLFFFRSVVNRVKSLLLEARPSLAKYRSDGGREGRFAVVHVTNGTDVYVGFGTLKFSFAIIFC
jgi:hypothetical protein